MIARRKKQIIGYLPISQIASRKRAHSRPPIAHNTHLGQLIASWYIFWQPGSRGKTARCISPRAFPPSISAKNDDAADMEEAELAERPLIKKAARALIKCLLCSLPLVYVHVCVCVCVHRGERARGRWYAPSLWCFPHRHCGAGALFPTLSSDPASHTHTLTEINEH